MDWIIHVCNPSVPMLTWEAETGESLEACRPASLGYAVTNNLSQKKWNMKTSA